MHITSPWPPSYLSLASNWWWNWSSALFLLLNQYMHFPSGWPALLSRLGLMSDHVAGTRSIMQPHHASKQASTTNNWDQLLSRLSCCTRALKLFSWTGFFVRTLWHQNYLYLQLTATKSVSLNIDYKLGIHRACTYCGRPSVHHVCMYNVSCSIHSVHSCNSSNIPVWRQQEWDNSPCVFVVLPPVSSLLPPAFSPQPLSVSSLPPSYVPPELSSTVPVVSVPIRYTWLMDICDNGALKSINICLP